MYVTLWQTDQSVNQANQAKPPLPPILTKKMKEKLLPPFTRQHLLRYNNYGVHPTWIGVPMSYYSIWNQVTKSEEPSSWLAKIPSRPWCPPNMGFVHTSKLETAFYRSVKDSAQTDSPMIQ